MAAIYKTQMALSHNSSINSQQLLVM